MAGRRRFLRWLPVAGLLLVGTALSVAAFLLAQRADLERIAAVFELRVEWRARDFERKLAVAAQAAGGIAHYIAAEGEVGAAQFHTFARLAHAEGDASSALYWSPFVAGADRAAFVAGARREVGADFEIREISPDDRFVAAAERPAYLPQLFEETFDGTPGVAGFDLMFRPARKAQVERARDSGLPRATPPFSLLMGGVRTPGFIVLWPVYTTGEVPATQEGRRAAFRGIATTRFRFDRFLAGAIAGTPAIAERIDIAVGAENQPGQHIASFNPAVQQFGFAAAPPAPEGLAFRREFELLGQRWSLLSRFPPDAAAELRSTAPPAWLTFGLLLTLTLCAFVWRQTYRLDTAEAEVSEKEARLQAIMDHSVDGLVTFDRQGTISGFSRPAEAMFGYPAAAVLGRPLALLLPTLDTPGSGRHEALAQRSDGASFPVDIAIGEIPQPEGPSNYVGAIRDVSEQRQLEATARQAQKMQAIGNLTGGMAHDFNNLLGVVIGNLDLAQPLLEKHAEAAKLVEDAIDAALRGADLTRALLAFARRQPLNPQRIQLNEQVAGITRLLSRTLGEHIEIRLDLAPDVWWVQADPAQLEACIANLATNARDAMPEGGQLHIRTANRHLDADYAATRPEVTAGDYAMIEVSDSGTGMPPELLSRIFEPFFTTKEPGKGTGLGLSMAFGFVKQSAGHIAVYSEPDKGTTFRLYFPRASAEAEARPAAPEPAALAAVGESVLLVEDNAALRQVAERQLADLGYRVTAVDAPAEALDILASEAIDLLFTDIVMPGPMDGFALAREALARWPRLKVLLTSGFPETRINGQLGTATTARLLTKPYRKQDLARVIRDVLDA